MKAGFFRKAWIMLASLYYIVFMCLRSIWYGRKGNDRAIDNFLHYGSIDLLNLVRAKLKIFGKENAILDKSKRYVLLCTHTSQFDIPLSYAAFPNTTSIRMITKKELFKIPLFGAAMRAARAPSIDRKNLKQAIWFLVGRGSV